MGMMRQDYLQERVVTGQRGTGSNWKSGFRSHIRTNCWQIKIFLSHKSTIEVQILISFWNLVLTLDYLISHLSKVTKNSKRHKCMSKCAVHFSVWRYCLVIWYFFPAPTNSYKAEASLAMTDYSHLSQQERKTSLLLLLMWIPVSFSFTYKLLLKSILKCSSKKETSYFFFYTEYIWINFMIRVFENYSFICII